MACSLGSGRGAAILKPVKGHSPMRVQTVRTKFFSPRRRLWLGLVGLPLLLATYTVAAGSVSKALTPSDLSAIAQLGVDSNCRDRSTFEAEVGCIRSIQAAVDTIVPDRRCAAKGDTVEPMDFIRRGYGCCFDRERFIGKALRHYGYEARRVALYERRYGYRGFMIPGINSHAATEVLTQRGWLGVDNEQPFVLVTHEGQPLRFDQLHQLEAGGMYGGPSPDHSFGFSNPYFVVYGLYSRHGGFHGTNLPAPEIHYPDFLNYTVFRRG
jgi:hypothetical protein